MRSGVIVFLLTALLFSPLTPSQAQKEIPLSLGDCVNLALRNNSQLRNSERRVSLAGTNVLSSWSAVLPRVNSSFASGKYIQGARVRKMDVPVDIDPVTGQVIYKQRDIVQESVSRYSHYARVSLTQNLFDFGLSWNRIKQADAGMRASEQLMVSTKQAVIFDVMRKYYELLKAQKLEEVYREAVNSSEEQVKRTESMYEIGSVALADVYKAKVNLGNNQILFITQHNLVAMAKANLNTAIGRDPDLPLEIIEVEAEEVPARYSFEEATRLALENNPELKSLQEDIKSYEYGVKVAKAAYLPSFGASVSYSRDNEVFDKVYSKNLNRDYSVSLGVGLDFNIFNGFADKAALDRENLNYHIAQEDLLNRQRTVKAEVEQAFLSQKAYREIAEIDQQNLVSAEEDLRLAQERYRVGSGTLLEVIDAQVGVTRARSTLVAAKYDTKIAQAQLEAAMGTLKE